MTFNINVDSTGICIHRADAKGNCRPCSDKNPKNGRWIENVSREDLMAFVKSSGSKKIRGCKICKLEDMVDGIKDMLRREGN